MLYFYFAVTKYSIHVFYTCLKCFFLTSSLDIKLTKNKSKMQKMNICNSTFLILIINLLNFQSGFCETDFNIDPNGYIVFCPCMGMVVHIHLLNNFIIKLVYFKMFYKFLQVVSEIKLVL